MCSMQGNNGLRAKAVGKTLSSFNFQNHPFWLLPKKAPCSVWTVECMNGQYPVICIRFKIIRKRALLFIKSNTVSTRGLRIILFLILLLKYHNVHAPACDVHLRLKTTGKAIRKRSWQTIKKDITQWNILKDNNFYLRRQVLGVKCLWKYWVMNKNRADLSNNAYSVSFKPVSGVCYFSRWTRGKNIAQSFNSFYTQQDHWINSSDLGFLSSRGQKISKDFLSSVYESWY